MGMARLVGIDENPFSSATNGGPVPPFSTAFF
jgi:hypothetical protein